MLITPTVGLRGHFGFGGGRNAAGRTFARAPLEVTPRYNIAPGQEIAIVRAGPTAMSLSGATAAELGREMAMVTWGLIPTWASASDIGVRIISCPAEACESTPTLHASFQSRRCLIPADGYFDWRLDGRGNRTPALVRLRTAANRATSATFGLAGVFDRWVSDDGTVAAESCTILMVPSNATAASCGPWMPALVRPQDYAEWLGEGGGADTARIRDLCRVWADDLTWLIAVGPAVHSPRFDDPRCVAPAGE